MLDWTLLGEFYSFCILFILFIRYYWHERKAAGSSRRTLFSLCLVLSMLSILLNVLCVIVLDQPGLVSGWLSMGLNTLYFLLTICDCSLFAYLLFEAMLEHVYDKRCLRRASVTLSVITGLSLLLLAVNLFTGVVFRVDGEGLYQRGPLNFIYYLLPVVELFFLGVCFVRNRSSIGERMLYVMRSMPPIILLLSCLQFLFPNVLLNGTLCAIASLIIFIAFRSYTVERDSLTGSGSRRSFIEELHLRCGSGQSIHFIQVGILNLGDVNLRYGNAVGNALLYEVSRYLRGSLPSARIFRTGGTTFTAILPLTADGEADLRLQMVEKRLREGWRLGDVLCSVNFSLAEMRSRDLTGDPGQVVEKLEYITALAKEKGLPVSFDREIERQFKRRSDMIRLMRESIEEDRFRVVFQPVYCCRRERFCSAEALLRLKDREGVPISPEIFIPLAEETGMIDDLTWIVLEKCCRLLCSDELAGLESVSLNLSMRQFLDPRLPAQIADHLDRYGVAHERLRVEITERFILHDARYAKRQLEALAALGIRIYMDDFGTGYSNLSGLLGYPFSVVKLDRSLIAPMQDSQKALLMVDDLMRLLGDLDKQVVAEGVEEAGQADHLKQIGVDMIQGFYYARPVPAEELTYYFGKL